jgi:hypothetical protein
MSGATNATLNNTALAFSSQPPVETTASQTQAFQLAFQLASAQVANTLPSKTTLIAINPPSKVIPKPVSKSSPAVLHIYVGTEKNGDVFTDVPSKPNAKGIVTWTRTIKTKAGKTTVTQFQAPKSWQAGSGKPLYIYKSSDPTIAHEETNPLLQGLMGASVNASAITMGYAGRASRMFGLKTGIPGFKEVGQALINAHEQGVEASAKDGSSIGGFVVNKRMNPKGIAAQIGGAVPEAIQWGVGGGFVIKGASKVPVLAKAGTWVLSKPVAVKGLAVVGTGLSAAQLQHEIATGDIKGFTRDVALMGAGAFAYGAKLLKLAATNGIKNIQIAVTAKNLSNVGKGLDWLGKLKQAAHTLGYKDLEKTLKIHFDSLSAQRRTLAHTQNYPTAMAGDYVFPGQVECNKAMKSLKSKFYPTDHHNEFARTVMYNLTYKEEKLIIQEMARHFGAAPEGIELDTMTSRLLGEMRQNCQIGTRDYKTADFVEDMKDVVRASREHPHISLERYLEFRREIGRNTNWTVDHLKNLPQKLANKPEIKMYELQYMLERMEDAYQPAYMYSGMTHKQCEDKIAEQLSRTYDLARKHKINFSHLDGFREHHKITVPEGAATSNKVSDNELIYEWTQKNGNRGTPRWHSGS